MKRVRLSLPKYVAVAFTGYLQQLQKLTPDSEIFSADNLLADLIISYLRVEELIPEDVTGFTFTKVKGDVCDYVFYFSSAGLFKNRKLYVQFDYTPDNEE